MSFAWEKNMNFGRLEGGMLWTEVHPLPNIKALTSSVTVFENQCL